jgi:hypothetical protein
MRCGHDRPRKHSALIGHVNSGKGRIRAADARGSAEAVVHSLQTREVVAVASAHVSIRQHPSASVSIRQHPSASVSSAEAVVHSLETREVVAVVALYEVVSY